MEEERLLGNAEPSRKPNPYTVPFQFYSEGVLVPLKKLKIEWSINSLNEEPLVQSQSLSGTSQPEIEIPQRKPSSAMHRQSFDSVFPKGRLEGDLKELHKAHILLRQQAQSSKFSKVYKCIDLNDCSVKALKIVSSRFKSRLSLLDFKPSAQESAIHEKLFNKGANVPRFYGSWIENNKRVIKMEFCHSNLSETMKLHQKFNKQFTEIEILQVMSDLVPALYQLHSLNCVHLDIKPGRLL